MGYKTAFKEIMRDYERDIKKSNELLLNRQEEIYSLFPRIKEIDKELINLGLKAAKSILNKENDTNKLVNELEDLSALLLNERNYILSQGGFSIDYLTKVYKCNKCKDTGYINTEKCSCLKQKLITKYYDLSNLSSVFKEENFDTFDLRFYSNTIDEMNGISPKANIQTIYRICSDFVLNFKNNFNNLLFYGQTGLGKTFLCNCIAKDILDMGCTVLYVTAPQIFKIIEDYRFNRDSLEEPNEYIETVYTVDLLIIDDLGTEFSTVVTSSELFNIMNSRLLSKRHTIISTNLSPNDFESNYSERIISRFLGYYKMMKFFGEDIRYIKKYKKRTD